MKKGYHARRLRCLFYTIVSFTAVVVIADGSRSYAMDYLLRGGLSLGYEYYERSYEDDSATSDTSSTVVTTTQDLTALADDQYDRLRITPLIAVTAVSSRDEVELRYRPSFRYNFDEDEDDLDHNLEFSLKRSLTQKWRLLFNEHYVYSDITENATAASDSAGTGDSSTISDNNGRRTYWTNLVSLDTDYTYWEDSVVSAGYNFSVLRNEESDADASYEDYDRHVFRLTNSHRFNSAYRLSATGEYIRGFFDRESSESDTDKDLREYKASTTLEATMLQNHPLSLQYAFDGVDYDDPDRRGNTLHNVTLGWKWQYSKDLNLSLAAGPSYRETDGLGDDWGFNGNFLTEYSLESVRIRWTGNKGYERQNFSGTDEDGLLDFYRTKLELFYTPMRDVTLQLYGSYHNEDQEEITAVTLDVGTDSTDISADDYSYTIESFNRERYAAGVSIGYGFWQYYSIRLAYDYTQQDSEKDGDSYEEHRASLTFSYEKDFLRW